MALYAPTERAQARAVAQLFRANPFGAARVELEERALGDAFQPHANPWSHGRDDNPNLAALEARAYELADMGQGRLARGRSPAEGELELYREVLLVALYDELTGALDEVIEQPGKRLGSLLKDAERRVAARLEPAPFTLDEDVPHLLALFFQVRRAFTHIFASLLGISGPAAELRAAVWDSIFTRDPARYRRGLYRRMADIPTLITGPSGTGKELVANAIGRSQYAPFDEARATFDWGPGVFLPLNLSALSPTLIESELFGHKKGAFTGAVHERKGWLAACPPHGAVFLDEIGELDPEIQVKLLRVLEARTFSPLGSHEPARFEGKVMAATNRDLAHERDQGRFRDDLYYRLCADLISTPSLRARIDHEPQELERLTRFLAAQIAGDDEAPALTAEVLRAAEQLGPGYPWPGNVRELSQCVRNVLIRGSYTPPAASADWWTRAEAGELSLAELSDNYIRHVHARSGSLEGAARTLDVDRRTVKARLG
jgi:MoxR-like ATPase